MKNHSVVISTSRENQRIYEKMKIFKFTIVLALIASCLVSVECGLDEDWALIYSAISNPAIVTSPAFSAALSRVILSLSPVGCP